MIMKTLHTIYTSFAKRAVIILTLLLTLGVTQVWGALSSPSACVFTSSSSTSLSDDNTDVTWIASTKPSGFESSGDKRGLQWSGSVVNGGLTLSCSSYSSYTITKIEVVWSRNNGAGASVSATVGGKSFGSSDTNNAKTTNRKATFTGSEKGDIVIKATSTATSHSFYIKSITVSYEDVASCTYIVQFDSNGGTGTMSDQTFTCDGAHELTPNSFSRTGYTFAGWNTEDDGSGDSYTNQQSVTDLTSNGETITLYAQWTPTQYTITYIGLEGATHNNPTKYTIESETITFTAPSERVGYKFTGWNPASITKGSTGNKTITAQWKAKDLTNYRTTCSTKADPNLSWSASTCIATMEVDNEFPTLTNPYELSITYLSSDPTVATIDENGTITLLKSGTTTITASYEEDEDYLSASTSYELTVEAANCKWVETEIGDIESGDEVVIAMEKKGDINVLTYALADNNTAAKEAPLATEISINANKTINTDITPISTPLIWNIDYDKEGTKNLVIYSTRNVGKWLYSNDANDGVRIGDNTNKEFKIVKGIGDDAENSFLYHVAQNRYLGVYYTENDWRGYTLTDKGAFPNNIKGQTLKFYKKECIASDEYWIIYNLENVTCNSEMPNYIGTDGEIELYFSANSGYKLPEQVSITRGGLPLSEDAFAWEAEQGLLYIIPDGGITGNLVITIEGCELLALPTNLKATNITSSSARLTWDEIEHAEQYQVHVTDDDDSTEDIITTTSSTYFEITGLKSASPYLWGVTPIASGYCGITQEAEYFETLDVYTVTFNSNGGTAVEPQTVDAGSKITAPANPSAAGYTFNYWYTTDANVPFDFNTPITGNTTLNAKWTPNVYTITFYKQSGIGGTDNATVTFNSNNYSVSTIEAPTREKYAFGGYYTEQHGAGVQVVDADGNWLKNVAGYTDANGNWIKAENTHLYAKWTAIYTITWVVNNNTETPYHTSTVLSGSTIDQLPTPPADDLFADCDVNAFVGWSTDNIGLEPDATAPTDLFKTPSEAQSKIGAINGDKKFYAVYASASNGADSYKPATTVEDLFDGQTVIIAKDNGALERDNNTIDKVNISPDGNGNLSNVTDNIKWTLEASDTHWKLKNNGGYLGVTSTASQTAVSVTETNNVWQIAKSTASGDYFYICQPNTTIGLQYYNSRWQIYSNNGIASSTNFTLKIYVPNVSNYITRCTALPDPVWGEATIDKTEIAVNCGETSSTNGAARISFPKETNYNLYKDITVEVTSGNFIIASSRDGEYTTSVTLTPTQSGTNVGTLDGKYVYVRAVAPPMSSNQLTGTITISGKQITTQVINVTATVTCNEYTLTFNDCGDTKTISNFAGTSVEEMEPWAETCSEPFQYVFDGWATAPVANGTEEYEKVDFSTFTMPNNNTTILYAVYRYAEEGGEPVNGYVKVTEALSDWSGDYVIVDDEFNVAIQNTYEEDTKDNKTLKDVSVTIKNDKIVSPTNDIIWTISKYGEYYTVYNAEAIKYAGITKNETRAAGLSETIATGYSMNIIFDSNTKIAKVSSTNYNRCFSYSESYPEWRTYSNNDAKGKTGYLYRFSNKTIRYTSSLVCGTIEAADALVTSTKDQKVKVKVPITLNYSEAASITGTSDNEAFTVVTKNNVAVGESNIEVHYKPTAYVNTANQEETATITLTTSNGATTIFNVTGRCLPETFAIVAKVGNVWYALPSQGLNSTTPPTAYPVEVDNMADPTAVVSVPANADWSLRQVYASSGSNDRFADNGEKLVFVNNANPQKALNAGSTGNYLLTNAQYDGYHNTTTPGFYEWTPTTTDLKTYQLTNEQRSRTLSVNTATVFGVHSDNKATTEVRFLPIQNRYTPAALQVIEWKENSVVIMYNGDPAQTASVSVNGAAAQNTTLSAAQRDIAVYELAADGLAANPTQRLSITIGSEKTILSIPYIINSETTDATILPGSTVAARQEVAKVSDLVILKDATLTADGAGGNPYKFRNVTIYGGGSLVIPNDKGFGANTLTMRVGGVENGQYENLYPQLQLKGTLTNTSEQINLDYLTTNDFYYPLSVPYSVKISDIQYPVDIYGANVASNNTGSFQFKYYNGAERAAGKTGWIVLDETANPTLNPNTGYAIWGIPKKVKVNGGESTRQKFGIHRLPLKEEASNMMTSEKQSHSATINVYNGSQRDSDNGWNYLGNPYLSHYGVTTADNVMKLGKLVWDEAQGAWLPTDTEQRYVVFTNDCQNYTAELASTTAIPAFSAFFIQADQGGAINFTSPNVATPQSLAARRSEEETKEITTGIILSGEKHSDRTGLLIADQFTQAYEFNADLSKFDNQDMNLYTISSSGKLAFMAINEDLAKQTIPLGYAVSTDGMYSIAFDEQRYSRNDIYALYLIDYDRNETTNLLHMDYNFYSETGAHAERFALQVAFAPNTLTDVEYTQVGDVLLSREGNTLRLDNLPSDATVTVYDAVGHLVEQHTASQLLQLTLQKGYYLLHIGNNQNSVVIDTFIP